MPNLSEFLIYTGETSLPIILWSIFAGVFIAAIASFVIKIKFGAFMQALLKNDASSPEKAMTLAETGIKAGFFVKFGLRSHASYKNLMVAVTDDGKYYANAAYTSEPPILKSFTLRQTKGKKSRIKESSVDTTNTEGIRDTKGIRNNEIEQTAETEIKVSTSKERVKFDIYKARYYIPKELHDRAASLYFGKPTKFVAMLGILVALGVVIAFSENIIIGLIDFMNNFIEGL